MASQAIKKRRLQVRLTPEGLVFVVILVFVTVSAILRSVNLLVVLAGMMIAPLLLSWRSQVHVIKSLVCRRVIAQHIHAGQIVNVQWECRNLSSRLNAWNILISDSLQWKPNADFHAKPASLILQLKKNRVRDRTLATVSFSRIGAGQSSFVSYKTLFSNRGCYEISNAVVSTTFPFGLLRSQIRLGMAQSVIVAPRLGKLSAVWDRRLQAVAAGSEALKRRRGIEQDEFYALRRWRSGDNRRHIHWRTTAKLGQPMVKQFDQPSNRDLAMVLDLFTPTQQAAADLDFADFDSWSQRTETALSFAATVLVRLGNAVQGQVAFGISGESAEVLTDLYHHELVVQIMRSLAMARSGASQQLGQMIVKLASCVSSGTPIYVVSSREKPAAFVHWGLTPTERSRLLPMLRWLDVRSLEFEGLFTPYSENDEKEIRRLQQKWVGDVDN